MNEEMEKNMWKNKWKIKIFKKINFKSFFKTDHNHSKEGRDSYKQFMTYILLINTNAGQTAQIFYLNFPYF